MGRPPEHMFSLKDAARAHAFSAARILGDDGAVFDQHPYLLPIFVSTLCQSLEAALKYAGIHSGLFQAGEARGREFRSGHGIEEITRLMRDRLRGASGQDIANVLSVHSGSRHAATIVFEMLEGERFARTRDSYWRRSLVYGEVNAGDFAYIRPFEEWCATLLSVAEHLDDTVETLVHWQQVEGDMPNFAVWLGGIRLQALVEPRPASE